MGKLTDTRSADRLVMAAESGDVTRIEELLESIEVGVCNRYGRNALMGAARNGHHAAAALLISRGANLLAGTHDGGAPIHYFAKWGWIDLIEVAMAHGACPTTGLPSVKSPLQLAVEEGEIDTVKYIVARTNWPSEVQQAELSTALGFVRDPDMVDTLIDLGANPNAPGKNGETPIFEAIRRGDSDTCRQLLARGARVDVEADTHTPMMLAALQNQPGPFLATLEAGGGDIERTPAGEPLAKFLNRREPEITRVYEAWRARNAIMRVTRAKSAPDPARKPSALSTSGLMAHLDPRAAMRFYPAPPGARR